MEYEEFERFEFTDEERANWIDILVNEKLREKVLVYDPDVLERIEYVIKNLKTLLKSDNCEYTIHFERCPYFETTIYVHLDVVDFGTSPKNFWIFQSIMDKINSFEAVWLSTGKVRLSFLFKFAFKELK
ncbi:MAG: hypothetical protein LBC73_04870 [Oscillospiraceae bacterium]|jgi:hypothetical protein|nr:hypothetical protein [Oscillospiraceae bacterium]